MKGLYANLLAERTKNREREKPTTWGVREEGRRDKCWSKVLKTWKGTRCKMECEESSHKNKVPIYENTEEEELSIGWRDWVRLLTRGSL